MSDLQIPDMPEAFEVPRMRVVGLALAWIKTGLLLVAAIAVSALGGGQEPAGQGFLFGGFIIGGLYWLAVVLPAFLLLRSATGRRVALGFALLLGPGLILILLAMYT